jgi:hypothetical protein
MCSSKLAEWDGAGGACGVEARTSAVSASRPRFDGLVDYLPILYSVMIDGQCYDESEQLK